ncbi:ATP-binding protein [Actinoplanes subtropicus]|uniref:ATP-binding protein n=1 Tax=Actinoplanes subtropicus TaxID=543632 RepID=UPI0004C3D3AE|nr:ATP-binding protein [Actinoplanes subtropicus]
MSRAAGLAPVPAARLAATVAALLARSPGATLVRIDRVEDARGARVEAVIRGPTAEGGAPIPPDLLDAVDAVEERGGPGGQTTRTLGVAVDNGAAARHPSWAALSGAAEDATDPWRLLAVALSVATAQLGRAEIVDTRTAALGRELEETSRGLLALHAELSEHQEQLEHARAAAVGAGQAKADFLANMSHEIRSPMNAVVGYTDLLLETDLTTEQHQYARAARAAGDHLLGVIDNVLDLSKIEAGRLDLEDIPFDLYDCVDDAVGIVALRAAEKNLHLAVLFAAGTPTVVRGDPLRLRQILVNLLANAVKFTACGRIGVEVARSPGPHGGHLLSFRISDTGRGIPAETLARIFSPYAQADASTARSHGGTGLGLSISQQLAQRMGGAITVESSVGQGSTFTCTIETQASTAGDATEDAGLLAGTTALVVHRDPLVVETIRRHLTSWGARTLTAATVDQAIAAHPRADLALIEAGEDDHTATEPDRPTDPPGPPPTIAITALAARAEQSDRLSIATPIRRNSLREAVLTTVRANRRRPGPPDVARNPGRPATMLLPGRVLYVDDDPLMVDLVSRIVGKEPGLVLDTAPDGATALRLAVGGRPDLILLDLNLTDTDGDTLLLELRANIETKSTPVIIVSGDAAPATIDRLTALGAAGYLAKPFNAAQLRELIKTRGRAPRASSA